MIPDSYNSPIVIDFESALVFPDGTTQASTEAYHELFRVLSMAVAYRTGPQNEIVSHFISGEDACRTWLQTNVHECARPVVVHNSAFEKLVFRCRFPTIKYGPIYDTMRLAQLYDNGGDETQFEYIFDEELAGEDILMDGEEAPIKVKRKPLAGMGLVKCLKRILGKPDHKTEAYEWIRANVPKSKGKEGRFLDKLPPDILERYNIGDVVGTLELYEFLVDYFGKIKFDWRMDHELYAGTVDDLVLAKIAGIKVDRERLRENLEKVVKEMETIESDFLRQFETEIRALVNARVSAWCDLPKTERGRQNRRNRLSDRGASGLGLQFNPGSNKPLADLFIRHLGFTPKFFTTKGQPSFKSSMLGQWGEGGLMLQKRRKRLIVRKQMEKLLELSAYDGVWHCELKVASVATGRFAGGGGLNVQGLSRKDEGLMTCLIPHS